MRLVAYLRLGYYLLKAQLLYLVGLRPGLRQFRENYKADRLLPVGTADQAVILAAGRCIHCGLCDAQFSGWASSDRSKLGSPSAFVIGYTRSLPDLVFARQAAAELQKGDLAALEKLCPVRVPFRQLAGFALQHGDAVARESRAPQMPAPR